MRHKKTIQTIQKALKVAELIPPEAPLICFHLGLYVVIDKNNGIRIGPINSHPYDLWLSFDHYVDISLPMRVKKKKYQYARIRSICKTLGWNIKDIWFGINGRIWTSIVVDCKIPKSMSEGVIRYRKAGSEVFEIVSNTYNKVHQILMELPNPEDANIDKIITSVLKNTETSNKEILPYLYKKSKWWP